MQVNPLIRKLEQFTQLSDPEKHALENAVSSVKDYAAREDIISQGERPDHLHLVLEGWAGRYKLLPDGERQIMAYLIPGDVCDVHVALLQQMDHSITALSACKGRRCPRSSVETSAYQRPSGGRFWWTRLSRVNGW